MPEQTNNLQDWTPKSYTPPSGAWQEQAAKLVDWAAVQLHKTPKALEWLKEKKGIWPQTARRFRLGWLPEDFFRSRPLWGLPEATNPDTGKARKVWLPAGYIIPVYDLNGTVLRIKCRPTPGERRPKYMAVPMPDPNLTPMNSRNYLNPWRVKEDWDLPYPGQILPWVVVESELDLILLRQEAGHLVNILALGSVTNRPDAWSYAALQAAPAVLIALDADEPGMKAAWEWWMPRFPNAKVYPVPEGKDPSDAWAAGWDLSEWIQGGLHPELVKAQNYFIQQGLREYFPIDTLEDEEN